MKPLNKSLLIASAAAALVLSGSVGARADEKTGGSDVFCSGINACKGQSACAGPNGCAGKNECKGHGTVKSTAAECQAKGGKIVADPSAEKE